MQNLGAARARVPHQETARRPAVHEVQLEGVFVQIGLVPNTEWLHGAVALTTRGEIDGLKKSDGAKPSGDPALDLARAKAAFAAKNPGKRNPYGALPQMRLLQHSALAESYRCSRI